MRSEAKNVLHRIAPLRLTPHASRRNQFDPDRHALPDLAELARVTVDFPQHVAAGNQAALIAPRHRGRAERQRESIPLHPEAHGTRFNHLLRIGFERCRQRQFEIDFRAPGMGARLAGQSSK